MHFASLKLKTLTYWHYLQDIIRDDWGDVGEEDRESNEEALLMQLRILSSYNFSKDKIWIITEADRSVTTILLPSDY